MPSCVIYCYYVNKKKYVIKCLITINNVRLGIKIN